MNSYGIVFLVALYANFSLAADGVKDEKIVLTKDVKKKKIKKQKLVQRKQEITPYQLAKNISMAINFLIKNKDYMVDNESILVERRKVALDLYRAEGYCVLTMADACFPLRIKKGKKTEDIFALINWSNIHPLLGKDVYSEGVKKFIDLNFKYSNDSRNGFTQSEVARGKLREIIHENLFSMIDMINKVSSLLPDRFQYSGHFYEGVAPLDHVALYDALSNKQKVALSSLDACYNKWQVALYRNLFLLLKLIAQQVKNAGATGDTVINDDNIKLLGDIAARELGDDNIALPEEC